MKALIGGASLVAIGSVGRRPYPSGLAKRLAFLTGEDHAAWP